MKSRVYKLFASLVLIAMLSAAFGGPAQADQPATMTKHTLEVSATGIYIVQLEDASLAAYRGGIGGLRATSPEVTGARQLDPNTASSQAYLAYLAEQQSDLLAAMARAYGRPVELVYQYQNVLNAVAVRIDHQEALRAFNLAGVRAVYPDQIRQLETDEGPELIGAPTYWNGLTPEATPTYGAGLVIGVLDSGINHAHPSFADVGADGYDHTNPWGSYVGLCATDPEYAGFCSDKLIGAYDFANTAGPEDVNGHGSHTASTAAGNFVDVEFSDGAGGTFIVPIQGVAPHANIVAYKVLNDEGSGTTSGIVAGINQGVGDMVDVMNYSISGTDDPWADPVDLAFLDAFTAGIFVSASAGNAGPDPATVAKTGPWNASVAGTTHSRILAHMVDVATDTEERLDNPAVEGNGLALAADLTAPILWGGDIDDTNILGCDAWPAGSFDGYIGLISRGDCTFEDKVNNLTDAGAVAVLMYNNVGGPPASMDVASATSIPVFMITLDDGLAVVDIVSGDPTAQATLHVAQNFAYNPAWADLMYGSSSRGPSQWDLLKPDYAAPAVNILAAVAAVGEDIERYEFYQGTSMAAPHGTGSAALIISLHPDWSPAEVKSAIALTAWQDIIDSDGVSPTDPFDIGSGRIDLTQAAFAGFVMDETSANYIAANPYTGGEPNTLNQPSMVEYTCFGTCTWTRTLKSTLAVDQEWQVSYLDSADMTLSASPETFTLPAGGEQVIEITATLLPGAVPEVYYFADVVLTPTGGDAAVAHLPVVVQMGISNLPDALDITTDQLAGSVPLNDLQAYYDITDLWVEVSGMALGDVTDLDLLEDPTPGEIYDDLTQVYWTTVDVPRDTMRLVFEIAASEAPDIDLFVGEGDTPNEDTELCSSASGIWAEYCDFDFPARGTYWVLVQNWEGSADQPDAIRLITGLVMEGDAGNLTVTGPATVPSMELFDLDVNWDEPTMLFGDYWYAQFSLGTERQEAGNLGYMNVDLEFRQVVELELTLLPLILR
jgi:hypothetical protein